MNKILEKVGEESIETILAVRNEDHAEIISESSDLIFHLLVLLAASNVTLDEIEKFAKEKNIDIKFTKMAEAREFRESKALREKGNKIIQPEKVNELPLDLNSVFEKN